MSDSTKIQDARRYSVPIINFTQFREILEPLIGTEGKIINFVKTPIPCSIYDRSSEYCYQCDDTKLICRVIIKDEHHFVKTCKCNLDLGDLSAP